MTGDTYSIEPCSNHSRVVLKISTALVLVISLLLIGRHDASAAPVYRETFQYCLRQGNTSINSSLLTGWRAIRKGKGVGDGGNLKSSPPGSPNVLKAFRSAPVGATSGNVLWTFATTTGLTIFTDEFSFDIGSIKRVQYDQRFDGLTASTVERDGSRIAFLIAGFWYISDQRFDVAKRSVWETVDVDLTKLTFGTSPGSINVGPTTPQNSGLSLPSNAVVTAFGVYIPRVNDRVRIDNFTLRDLAPEDAYGPGEDGDLTPCQVVNPQGTPVNPQGTPITPTVKPETFCSDTQIKSLGKLKLPTRLAQDIIKTLGRSTTKGKRDAGLLLFIAQMRGSINVEQLTNMRVKDYDSVSGVLRIPSSIRSDQNAGVAASGTDVKLNRLTRSAMNRYLRSYKASAEAFLWPQVDRGLETPIATSLCTKQFARLLRLRAERIGLRIKFIL
jgi:hypothetical protein